jgi:hypothetical protein
MSFIKSYMSQHGNPVFRVSVDYVTSTSDYVEDSDKGTLQTLEVVARTYGEYLSFFKKVAKLMRMQCDCPAGADDFHVHLSPVFRVVFYRDEKEFVKNSPRDYSFVRFNDGFYKQVSASRCRY